MENERILKSMDNVSDAIDFSSKDYFSKVEQILIWMKSHIEEKLR